MHPVGSGKMAAAREHFEYSLRSASNDHYIKRNDSSSTILPTINDIQCEVKNTSDYYSCKVYYYWDMRVPRMPCQALWHSHIPNCNPVSKAGFVSIVALVFGNNECFPSLLLFRQAFVSYVGGSR